MHIGCFQNFALKGVRGEGQSSVAGLLFVQSTRFLAICCCAGLLASLLLLTPQPAASMSWPSGHPNVHFRICIFALPRLFTELFFNAHLLAPPVLLEKPKSTNSQPWELTCLSNVHSAALLTSQACSCTPNWTDRFVGIGCYNLQGGGKFDGWRVIFFTKLSKLSTLNLTYKVAWLRAHMIGRRCAVHPRLGTGCFLFCKFPVKWLPSDHPSSSTSDPASASASVFDSD